MKFLFENHLGKHDTCQRTVLWLYDTLLGLSCFNHLFLVVLSLLTFDFGEQSLVNFSQSKLDSHDILLLQSPKDSHQMSEYSDEVQQA